MKRSPRQFPPFSRGIGPITVIPLFTKRHRASSRFFASLRRTERKLWDALAGHLIRIAIPKPPFFGSEQDVLVTIQRGTRYPGLQLSDLPVLWIEPWAHLGQEFYVKLPRETEAIRELMYRLLDGMKTSRSALELRERLEGEPAGEATAPPVPAPLTTARRFAC